MSAFSLWRCISSTRSNVSIRVSSRSGYLKQEEALAMMFKLSTEKRDNGMRRISGSSSAPSRMTASHAVGRLSEQYGFGDDIIKQECLCNISRRLTSVDLTCGMQVPLVRRSDLCCDIKNHVVIKGAGTCPLNTNMVVQPTGDALEEFLRSSKEVSPIRKLSSSSTTFLNVYTERNLLPTSGGQTVHLNRNVRSHLTITQSSVHVEDTRLPTATKQQLGLGH
ncbi:hypothetical protein Tco_0746618 [Tanacetum coccineum]